MDVDRRIREIMHAALATLPSFIPQLSRGAFAVW
jgi:hypothetical protein